MVLFLVQLEEKALVLLPFLFNSHKKEKINKEEREEEIKGEKLKRRGTFSKKIQTNNTKYHFYLSFFS